MLAKTAMQLALQHPEKVDKLVVVDIAPKPYAPEHEQIFQALFSIRPNRYARRKDIDAALAPRIADASLRQFLMKNLARGNDGSFEWKLDLDAIYRNYAVLTRGLETGGRFDKPALFIRGERSGYIAREDTALVKALFPYSRIVTLPGVGHWVHAEARRRFARVVLAFLGI